MRRRTMQWQSEDSKLTGTNGWVKTYTACLSECSLLSLNDSG